MRLPTSVVLGPSYFLLGPWSLVELGLGFAPIKRSACTAHEKELTRFSMTDQGLRTAAQRPDHGRLYLFLLRSSPASAVVGSGMAARLLL
jgi:hypothetical protein